MLDKIDKEAAMRMDKSIEALRGELARMRTGRASTALLDSIMVSYYGNPTPLNQVANVSVQDARTLSVQPWEKTLIADIERAIMESDLGLNPTSAGDVIRIPLPPLTEERRKEIAKLVRHEGENAKISIRNIRRDLLGDVKNSVKDKEISEDDSKRSEQMIQKITDEYVAKVDSLVAEKESEIMSI